jgi:diguanylate cyclase (GGDEF)-like protein
MSQNLYQDEWAVIEAARKRVADGDFGDGESAAAIAEVLDHFENVLNETIRLVRISDRIGADLQQTANTDELTGIFNRRYFVEIVELELQRSVRFGHPLSVLVIDIDHFEKINQDHGRGAGDVTLKTLVAAVIGILRKIDFLARIGGEEFAAMLPETDTTGAVILAERLRESIARMGIAVGRESVEITISIGIASRGEQECTAEDLLRMADQALAVAKDEGRNRVVVASWQETDPTKDAPVET